jgi:ribonuclease D
MTPQLDYDYIDSNQMLAQFCAGLSTATYCVIDTEFVRESTYYPELALIQIASGDQLACIDPLAISEFTPLAELLVEDSLLKVFHSSSQDLEILYQKFGQVPTPVFDTQLAAAVLGYNHQISYADLVQQITGVTLEKKHTRANWTRRPLSEDELDYAMDDVRYLLAVYETLNEKLESSRRYSWMEKDLRTMSDPASYQVDMVQLWKRLKGVQKLKGEKLQIASELVQWREALAQRQNRPRRWIVKDEVIVDIARQKPADIEALSRIRDLSEKTANRHGDKLLQIVAHATQVDASQWPQHDKQKNLNKQQLALGDCLMALCRVIADQNQIALATLATRKDIDNLLINQKSSRLTQGWRFAMAGEQLLEFIHGQSSISVDQERLILDPR